MHIDGDLLESDCDIIVQQLNCIGKKGFGLSKSISDKYKYANVYSKRTSPDVPGLISISRPPNNRSGPIVIGIFGQYSYGKRKTFMPESEEMREEWFLMGLTSILNTYNDKSYKIGFPYKIGCGLAKGNWNNYLGMIKDFASKSTSKVFIYKI